ncbi:MAG TPA: hypothetical protein VFC58_09990 [Desulfosporosinus sp.]|nr:hypothetical protein [Desulfosporosinus sp.]
MNLIPRLDAQKLTTSAWYDHTPGENKLELIDGQACWGGVERDRLLMALLYNIGFEHLLAILPRESREILHHLCQEDTFLDAREKVTTLADPKVKIALDILDRYLETSFGEESQSLRNTVRMITDLDTIERIIERILADNSIDEHIDNVKALVQSEIAKSLPGILPGDY